MNLRIYLLAITTLWSSQVVAQDFWWWNGGYDPFLAMHAGQADWAHLESQPQHQAPLKFSESILSPLVPYTAYVHNDSSLIERQRLTITGWKLNPVDELQWEQPPGRTWEIPLTVPRKAGTYLLNLETYYAGNPTPQTYKTGGQAAQ